ncbi:hypothetical protein Y886_07615 [Xanthomonas hyacinthi DSM 19077]|nr:hypothetical protein Y886_07615 [Xanthomonas hyacinthi DSM 19077]
MAEGAFLLKMKANGLHLVISDALIQPFAISGSSTCRVGIERKIGGVWRKGWVGHKPKADTRAGPAVVLCQGSHGGAHGIEFDVALDHQQIALGFDEA